MSSVEEIGSVPWSLEEIRGDYEAFRSVYARRPITDNVGGMKAPHAFGCWFMLRRLKPKLIVESGVWKGQGTWLIEQACPEADLICLDVNLGRLEYRSPRAEYVEEDFSTVSFSGRALSEALCFFDDHQNALMRLQQMRWKGFSRAIFEDNYPPSRGDCYSLKKMFGESGHRAGQAGDGLRARIGSTLLELLGTPNPMHVRANATHAAEARENLRTYYEFPPLFREALTRWGDAWDDARYPTKDPIIDAGDDDPLRNEARDYTWMCYVELK